MAEGFPDFKKLRSTLLTSGVQQTNNALWQTIDQLLTNLGRLEALIDAASGSSSGGGSAGTITGAESSPIWREQEFDYNPLGVPGPTGPQGPIGPPGMPGDLDGGIEEAAYSNAASPAGGNPIGGFTPGSIIFAGAGGTLSQDNTHLFFNRTNFRVGIGLVNPSNLLDVFGAGTDIGYVARFTENNTAGSTYLQIRSPSGNANAQAGFTCFQQQNGIEWRFTVVGNEANAFRISGGAAATNFMYISVNGNVIINDSQTDPATGTKSLIFGDGTAPATLDANTAGLYANDVGGTVEIFGINEAGLVSQLTGTGKTYTPTRSAEVNLDANVTLTEAQYARVGDTVTVSGRFTADPTLTGTATSFEMTLPIASNIGAVEDVAGVAFCGTIAGQGAEVIGSVANNTAVIQWISGDITSQSWSYIFTYQVI